MSSKPEKLVIAAIDFGTTYSGYAYSFKHELDKDQTKVYANYWHDESGNLQTHKAPTAVLFKEDMTFHSFGFEAEQKYAELVDDNEHVGWRYFRHFKMKLHDLRRLRRTMKLMDDQGKRMPAIDVFAAAIKYLKDHLMKTVEKNVDNLEEEDVYWVLTVPAIWQYCSKQFMKEAALKAGISMKQFTLAIEPECAAIYCQYLEVEKVQNNTGCKQFKTFAPGTKFMVLDLGGGTIDITVSEVKEDGALKELYPPSGGPWGGVSVDDQINAFISKVFGEKVMRLFEKECKAGSIEKAIALELKKRQIDPTSENLLKITLPISLFETYKEVNHVDFKDAILKSEYSNTVKMRQNKLCIKNQTFVEMFYDSKTNLLNHVRNLLNKSELHNISKIMMVGGFSESLVLQTAIKDEFYDKNVIVPNEAGTVILKGAVMYGYKTDAIVSRKLPFSYGIASAVPFDDSIHPENKISRTGNGYVKCEDVFHAFVKKGDTVEPGRSKVKYAFMTADESSDTAEVEVYQTSADVLKDPSFVTDPSFELIGKLEIKLSAAGRREVEVEMAFGGIELQVEAIEKGTHNKVEADFEFLF